MRHNGPWPVKRRRALLESNLPRNNWLKLIATMEVEAVLAVLHLESNIGAIDFPCLRKLIEKAAAQRPPGFALPVAPRTRRAADIRANQKRRSNLPPASDHWRKERAGPEPARPS